MFIKRLNIDDMQKKGLQLTADEIYNIKNKLETKIKNFISTEIEWKSLNTKIISKDKLETTIGFLETLEEEDDIQSVYTNFKVENN